VKLFESFRTAVIACAVCKDNAVSIMSYRDLCISLSLGVAFSFESTEMHTKFLKRLKNDPAYCQFYALSADPKRVLWTAQAAQAAPVSI
jgi:hypothetical protein